MTQAVISAQGPTDDPHGPLKIGSRLRKYEILALIGRGGYASVYHARDTIFKRDVAIKVIHRMGDVTEDMMRRGQAEATFLAKFRHPNIVEVYDADFTDSGLLFIVMELLIGRTLYAALREHHRLAVEEALLIGCKVATAVGAAHEMGAIHRDLKPDNIFITANNGVKVLDFGIAKFVNDVAAKTTAKDALQGTVLYMSPEHVQGAKIGVHTDIYALGIILYRILYGEHPALMDIENPTSWAVASWHLSQMPRPLSEIAHWIPRHVSRVVSSACAKDPRDRPQSMAFLSSQATVALERFLAESQGELKGNTRDLSRPALPTDPKIVHVLPGNPEQRFQAFSEPQSVQPAKLEPKQLPAAEGNTLPGTGKRVQEPRAVRPAAIAPAEPLIVASKPSTPPVTAVQSELPVSKPVTPTRGATRNANVLLIAAAVSGALVFGVGTKLYFKHRKSVLQSAIQIEPFGPPSAVVASGLPVTQPPPAVSATPQPSVVVAVQPRASVSPTLPRVVTAKPKKLTPSEQRLKALEDELKRREKARFDDPGTLMFSPK